MLAVLAVCGSCRAQLVVKTNNSASVSGTSTLYIDVSPTMPQLNLSVSGGALTCDSLSYTLDIDWTATTGPHPAQETFAELTGSFPCNQTSSIDWASLYAGGTATLTWSDDCGDAGTLSFKIRGTNPSPAMVDSFIPSTPWFWRNMLAWESGAWSTSPTGIYHQFEADGTPLNICQCPNGIGLTQLDGKFPSGVNDFWAWNYNLVDGFNLLASYSSAATSAWNNEYSQMVQSTAGTPVYPPTTTIPPNCVFMYPVANSGHSYVDANLIRMYNNGPGFSQGVYNGAYIFWDPPIGTVAGFWDPEDNSQNYVHHVCQTNSL